MKFNTIVDVDDDDDHEQRTFKPNQKIIIIMNKIHSPNVFKWLDSVTQLRKGL